MNQKRLSPLTIIAIATIMSAPLSWGTSPQAAIAQQSDPLRDRQGTQNPGQNEDSSTQIEANSNPAVSSPETETSIAPSSDRQNHLVAQIYSHLWGEEPAVTLYVRGIPVLTFIDPETETARSKSSGFVTPTPQAKPIDLNIPAEPEARSRNSNYDPVWRATNVAARLNYLTQNNLDPNAITVGWNENFNAYLISVGDEPLVTIDNRTLLPDTTRDLTHDALQATNRLRRLLGDAPPLDLSQIAVRPEFNTAPVVQTQTIVGQQRGMASWYGPGFHGRRSASGERFNQNALTAAHRTLPFGTQVRVTNLNNGQSTVVRINDRGPFSRGRVIDLSAAAARKIGMMGSGVAPVQLEILGR
ncbi:MAG: septal ring lytic transglycosylase RlpA family protein [Jaaginema sp. PMC 1079.18]|nr:septal ring lytic transglycosylase RlpA family protein [Jaaginema sp. PMC 1080.18]MEC4851093.1 septal ring lytic transglycosylase RlpA family protein [Jaaginema sp. PMC 1079.18]MEC4867041.1 septal ring lytic transglycosylase RlpA family protein [Jaaginema sp. PMC 1078.18]